MHPDSDGYAAFPRALLQDRIDAGRDQIERVAISPMLARTPGYPLFLAACMSAGGTVWPWLAAALQVLAMAAALALLAQKIALLGARSDLSAAAAVCAVATPLTQWGISILTEGLYLPLLFVALALLIDPRSSRPGVLGRAALAGVAVACACLIRDGTVVLALAFLPALLLVRPWAMALARVAAFAGPILVAVMALLAWNEYRTGVRFLSTVQQWALPEALLVASRRSFELVYRPDGPFTEAARAVLHRHELDEVFAMNRRLFDEFGMNAVEQARTARAIFLEAWMRAPATLAMLSLTRLNATLLGIVFDPVRSLGAIGQIAGRDWILLASLTRAVRLAARGDIGAMLIAAATVLSRAIAAAVWVAAGWAVLRALGSRRRSLPHPGQALALALFVVVWTGLCLPFRVNDRYLSPIIPPLLALAALALSPASMDPSATRSPGPSGILRSPAP